MDDHAIRPLSWSLRRLSTRLGDVQRTVGWLCQLYIQSMYADRDFDAHQCRLEAAAMPKELLLHHLGRHLIQTAVLIGLFTFACCEQS